MSTAGIVISVLVSCSALCWIGGSLERIAKAAERLAEIENGREDRTRSVFGEEPTTKRNPS